MYSLMVDAREEWRLGQGWRATGMVNDRHRVESYSVAELILGILGSRLKNTGITNTRFACRGTMLENHRHGQFSARCAGLEPSQKSCRYCSRLDTVVQLWFLLGKAYNTFGTINTSRINRKIYFPEIQNILVCSLYFNKWLLTLYLIFPISSYC